MLNRRTTLMKCEHVTWRKLGDDKAVLLDLNSGHYYTLNETATFIWELIISKNSLGEIVRRVSEAFDIGAAPVEEDMNQMLEFLLGKGLLSENSECQTSLREAENNCSNQIGGEKNERKIVS